MSLHLHCPHTCSLSPHTQPLVYASTESSALTCVCHADRPEFASHQAVIPVWPSREHPRVWGKVYQADREREQPLLYKGAATSRPPPKNNTPGLCCVRQDPRSGHHGVRWCPIRGSAHLPHLAMQSPAWRLPAAALPMQTPFGQQFQLHTGPWTLNPWALQLLWQKSLYISALLELWRVSQEKAEPGLEMRRLREPQPLLPPAGVTARVVPADLQPPSPSFRMVNRGSVVLSVSMIYECGHEDIRCEFV